MGTTQFDSGEFGETFAEKNVRFDSAADQTTGKQGVENGNGSEPEIYLLISHGGRKHDPRGGRKIGLFGPFGPPGHKGFGFPRGGPRRIDHPHAHERPHGRVERSDVRRGPPHAREFRHGPRFMHNPEKEEEFTDEHGYGPPHRGMRRFGPGPHGKRGPTLEPGSEFHREPRHHGGPGHRPHGFDPREQGHGPRGGPRGRFEVEERIRSPSHRHHPPSREHGRGPRGGGGGGGGDDGPRGRFETAHSPYRRLPREHGHGPRGKFEAEENVRQFHRGGPRGKFEAEENVRQFHRGGPRGKFETEENVRQFHRGGPRGKFETEENGRQFHRGKPGNHECSPPRDPQSHKHGYGPHGKLHDPRERFEAEENGKHGHSGDRLPSPGPHEHGRRNERGSPSREHGHGPRGRFERESGYQSDHSEHHRREFGHRGGRRFEHEHDRHGSEPEPEPGHESDHSNKSFGRHRGGRRFEHGRHESESEYQSDYSGKSFEHHRGGRRFEHDRHRPDSHHLNEIFRNHRGGFNSRGRRRLSRDGPRLHRHARGHRHGVFRSRTFPHHHHPNKPLAPEELAEKVALLNSMGFTPENNSHYEELLRKFNGRINRVVDILFKEQEKEREDDERKDEDDEGKEGDDERREKDEEEEENDENKEDYDVVEEEADQQS